MNSFSKYSNNLTNVINSPIFYWPLKKTNVFKVNNKIIGYYKDNVIKRKIYLSNNGLHQNSALAYNQVANNLNYSDNEIKEKRFLPLNKYFIKSELLPFISYFYLAEDSFGKFTIYPTKYFRDNFLENKKKNLFFESFKKFKLKKQINNQITNLKILNSVNNFNFFSV